ncbi:MAG: TonB family protein [Acidobacteriaceae bacterium]
MAKGQVQIRLRILPDGKVKPRDIVVEVSSGDRTLDHAALKAIKKSKYPPLPQKFHGPYLEMRACFNYNVQSSEGSSAGVKAPKR